MPSEKSSSAIQRWNPKKIAKQAWSFIAEDSLFEREWKKRTWYGRVRLCIFQTFWILLVIAFGAVMVVFAVFMLMIFGPIELYNKAFDVLWARWERVRPEVYKNGS